MRGAPTQFEQQNTNDNRELIRWLKVGLFAFSPVAWMLVAHRERAATHVEFHRKRPLARAVTGLMLILVGVLGLRVFWTLDDLEWWWRALGEIGAFWVATSVLALALLPIVRRRVVKAAERGEFDNTYLEQHARNARHLGAFANVNSIQAAKKKTTTDKFPHERFVIGGALADDPDTTQLRKQRLGRGKASSCPLWKVGSYVSLPCGHVNTVTIARSGWGKTALMLLMMIAGIQGPQRGSAVVIDCKPDYGLATELSQVAQALGIPFVHWRRTNCDVPFAGFEGGNAAIIAKINTVAGGDPRNEAVKHYRQVTDSVLQRVAQARDTAGDHPWACPAEVLNDIQNRPVAGLSNSERTIAFQNVQKIFAGIETTITAQLGQKTWNWEELDTTQGIVLVTVDKDPADRNAVAWMLADLERHQRHRTKDALNLNIFIDEVQMLLDSDVMPNLATFFEKLRSARIGLHVACQTVAALGEQEERILGSGATLIAGQTNDPEPLCNRAGTKQRGEQTVAVEGASSQRVQDVYKIPPNALRTAPKRMFVIISGEDEPVWFKTADLQTVLADAFSDVRPASIADPRANKQFLLADLFWGTRG